MSLSVAVMAAASVLIPGVQCLSLGTVITVPVAHRYDDVEENERNGRMYYSSSDLELLHDSHGDVNQIIGIRWRDVPIPTGATILEAHIDFVCNEASGGPGPAVLIGFDTDADSDVWWPFDRPSQRTLSRNVVWPLFDPWVPGVVYSSPNLAVALQEVVSNPDWESDNAVSAVIHRASRPTSAKRVAESRNGNGVGPKLRVRYYVRSSGVSMPPPPSTPLSPAPGVFNVVQHRVRISGDDDDVEERPDGELNFGSSDLELPYEKTMQKVGLRFRGVGVPRGAHIVGAFVEFTADEDSSVQSPVLVIRGEAADSSAYFSEDHPPSRRVLTTASVQWDSMSMWSRGRMYRTPDLSSVIAEITGRDGWLSTSSLALLIESRDPSLKAKRVADSRDGNKSKAACLVITYRKM